MQQPLPSFLRLLQTLAAVVAACTSVTSFAVTAQCTAVSGPTVPLVVELYTSEGCDSCPPADRFLSKAIAERSKDAAFIPLAFHVDYWDYIGWKDAFAQPAYGKRQSALAASSGASGVYTPQIFVNGREDRAWSVGAAQLRSRDTPATVKFSTAATWQDDGVALSGKFSEPAAAVRLRYVVTENGLVTAVKAGENKGVTLRHDAVVRAHGPVSVDAASGSFALTLPLPRSLKRAASLVHVIAEDSRGAPLAAATMLCPG